MGQPAPVPTDAQVPTAPPRDARPVSAKTQPASLRSREHMSPLLGHTCLKSSGRKKLSRSKELTQTDIGKLNILLKFSDVL